MPVPAARSDAAIFKSRVLLPVPVPPNNAIGGVRAHVNAKDYAGVAKDAGTLNGNFTKIEAFWTQKKFGDAINFAKAGAKAAADLESAARSKNDAGIAQAQRAVESTCQGCHQEYRLMVVTEGRFEIIVREPSER